MSKPNNFDETVELKRKINTLEKKLKHSQSKKYDADFHGKEDLLQH